VPNELSPIAWKRLQNWLDARKKIEEMEMIEWILVVWLVSCPVDGVCSLAPAFEVGTYRQLERCEASRDTVKTGRSDVGFIARCIERDKQ